MEKKKIIRKKKVMFCFVEMEGEIFIIVKSLYSVEKYSDMFIILLLSLVVNYDSMFMDFID